LNVAGWVLSALHQLNRTGYFAVLVLGLVLLGLWWRSCGQPIPAFNLTCYRRRFGRVFPLAFGLLCILAILGGVLYQPSNYDALAYRIPRVLHWLSERQWHWIHASSQSFNVHACGVEWVSAPLIALTGTDRGLFLINAISFLLLPGLVFAVFVRLGVRPRVAWHWMWLIPVAGCFLLQAGSIANDLFGATLALAAFDLALRARDSMKASYGWWSIAAAGVMTAGKTSNILLLLPWLIAIAPAWRPLARRVSLTLLVSLIALGASFAPTAILNFRHCGDFTGSALVRPPPGSDKLWINVTVNAIYLAVRNLSPPVLPAASQVNAMIVRQLPSWLADELTRNFDGGVDRFALGELPTEEGDGLGLGLTLLITGSFAAAFAATRLGKWRSSGLGPAGRWRMHGPLIIAAAWLVLLVFMAKAGFAGLPRQIAPFYCLLMSGLLFGNAQATLVRQRSWRRAALAVIGLALIPLVLSPARPLWPATWLLAKAGAQTSGHRLLHRAYDVYAVYRQRARGFDPVIRRLPPDTKVLGLIARFDPETSLWRPFGARRIVCVTPTDGPDQLTAAGVECILVCLPRFETMFPEPFDQWLQRVGGIVQWVMPLELRTHFGPEDWCLVHVGRKTAE
jgi:hypothetical protein